MLAAVSDSSALVLFLKFWRSSWRHHPHRQRQPLQSAHLHYRPTQFPPSLLLAAFLARDWCHWRQADSPAQTPHSLLCNDCAHSDHCAREFTGGISDCNFSAAIAPLRWLCFLQLQSSASSPPGLLLQPFPIKVAAEYITRQITVAVICAAAHSIHNKESLKTHFVRARHLNVASQYDNNSNSQLPPLLWTNFDVIQLFPFFSDKHLNVFVLLLPLLLVVPTIFHFLHVSAQLDFRYVQLDLMFIFHQTRYCPLSINILAKS